MCRRSQSCPNCGSRDIDVTKFKSMMVISDNVAFFTLSCPACGASLSTIAAIPASLRAEVAQASTKIRTEMGKGTAN